MTITALPATGAEVWLPPGRRAAYVNGARDGLWWEFSLGDSFRWQALTHDLPEPTWLSRMHSLVGALHLSKGLSLTPEQLNPGQRALADLAVALLPHPDLLAWEAPFTLMNDRQRERTMRLVRTLVCTEGLVVVMVNKEESTSGRIRTDRVESARSGHNNGNLGRCLAQGEFARPGHRPLDHLRGSRTAVAGPAGADFACR